MKFMKNITITIVICILIGLFSANFISFAGNRDRSGQAGAQHLLIDPWARTNGWGTAGVAEVRGLEAIYSNVAGISFINKTEAAVTRTQYLSGSGAGITINSFGIVQALKGKHGSLGTLGISVFNMGFGDIPVTTVSQPDGTSAIFSPKLNYIGLYYAYKFNRYIRGGIGIKIVNESISDLVSTGIGIDAGVQYVSGPYENFKIGVTLKNLGMPTSYSGDGLSFRANPVNSDVELTVETRSAEAVLPACLVIGTSYDFLFFTDEYANMSQTERTDLSLTRADALHRITLAGSFTANAYSNDIFALGVEYGYQQYVMFRAGYTYENGQFDLATSTTFYSGPSAGVTFGLPLAKDKITNSVKSILFIDYGYRFTNRWKGNHYIGLKLSL